MAYCPMRIQNYRSAIQNKLNFYLQKAEKNRFPKFQEFKEFVAYINRYYLGEQATFKLGCRPWLPGPPVVNGHIRSVVRIFFDDHVILKPFTALLKPKEWTHWTDEITVISVNQSNNACENLNRNLNRLIPTVS